VTGSEFRKWRRYKEISQQVVADYAECNRSTICRWEKGELNIVPELLGKILLFYENQQGN
jgi:transcriptional regulator with XRE-family HTH domain